MDDFFTVTAALLNALKKAQTGNVYEAETDLQSIRSTWFVERSPELMVDLMIVECVCAVYSGKVSHAKDRVSRALAVAKLSHRSECIFAASAWLAYVSMIEGDARKAANVLVDGCAVRPENLSPLAEFRSSSILAVLLEYLGFSVDAAHWFERARVLASRTGLPGPYSSTIYNMAVARVSASMLSKIQCREPSLNPDLDLLATRSAMNFDNITNVHVLDPLHRLIEAQALYLCGRIPQALSCIESFLTDPQGVSNRFIIRAEFELLRCRLASQIIPAEGDLEKLRCLLHAFQSDDELALVKDALAEGYAAVGANDVASSLKNEITLHLHLHQKISDSIFLDFKKVGFLPVSASLA